MSDFRSRRKLAASGALTVALVLSACGGEQSPPIDPEPAFAAEPSTDAAPGDNDLALPELPDIQTDEAGAESVDLGANPFAEAKQVEAAVDGVAFEVSPAEPVSLTSGGMVTVHWAGTSGGTPVAGDACQGMVTVTTPMDELITFKSDVTGCSGSEGIWISESVGATAGDYTVTVILDGSEASQTVTVTA